MCSAIKPVTLMLQPLLGTPLPIFQLFIIVFIQAVEPITSTAIYPFADGLIKDLNVIHGTSTNDGKSGYLVGLVESMFYVAEAITVFQWNRMADKLGRRPVLLAGLLGTAWSVLILGISTNYWMILLSRCAQGIFNGNSGVAMNVVTEITDKTNKSQAFALLPLARSMGSTFGPLIGGTFANPAERWPAIFGRFSFFSKYPYFLSCAATSMVPFSAYLVAYHWLEETKPTALEPEGPEDVTDRCRTPDGLLHDLQAELLPSSGSVVIYGTIADVTGGSALPNLSDIAGATVTQFRAEIITLVPPIRSLLSLNVILILSNFAFLAFLDQSLLVLLPLVYSTPMEVGGLGLAPSKIGGIMGMLGTVNAFLQTFCFAPTCRRLGQRRLFTAGIAGLGLCFLLFPVLIRLAVWHGHNMGISVWTGIVLQLASYTLTSMSYSCIFLYVAECSHEHSVVSAVNGLAQIITSSIRAMAPITASSLFAFSLQLSNRGSLVGYYLVYFCLASVATIAYFWGTLLPDERDETEEPGFAD